MSEVEVTRIRVGKHPTGIVDLKKTISEVARESGGKSDDIISAELFDRLSKKNYIHESLDQMYRKAFMREYKKFVGEPVEEESFDIIEIKVLGPGCPNCEKLEQDLMTLMTELKIFADFEHVRDPLEIAKFGFLKTPALVINGEVKASGARPSAEKLRSFLLEASENIRKNNYFGGECK